jgi:aldehyde dehydrogenase (NAD+)
MEYGDIAEAIDFVNKRPKPLALYLFTDDKEIQEKVRRETSSGGMCINDAIVHFGSLELPYGGVGDSGFGKYHGKASFDLLSNKKSLLEQTFLMDFKIRYPPYKPGKREKLRKYLG